MVKVIIQAIMGLISSLFSIIWLPVNAIFETLFPNMSHYIQVFTNFCDTFLTAFLGWFTYILPPTCRVLILTWFNFVLVYYGIVFTIRAINLIYLLIQKIKFW